MLTLFGILLFTLVWGVAVAGFFDGLQPLIRRLTSLSQKQPRETGFNALYRPGYRL